MELNDFIVTSAEALQAEEAKSICWQGHLSRKNRKQIADKQHRHEDCRICKQLPHTTSNWAKSKFKMGSKPRPKSPPRMPPPLRYVDRKHVNTIAPGKFDIPNAPYVHKFLGFDSLNR